MSATSPGAALLDIEGTLYAHGELLPGATATISWLRQHGWVVRFLTNIDSRPGASIAAELATLGLDIREGELFTPVSAAQTMLSGTTGTRLYPLVPDALRPELAAWEGEPPYTHVLVGDIRENLSYQLLDTAFRALRGGAQLLALQRGRYFKRPDGDHIDTGAIVTALEYASGLPALVLGKPAADFFALAARSAAVPIAGCLVVGDDASTDIAGGNAAEARTVQVRTGKYADQAGSAGLPIPSATIDSIADLPSLVGGGQEQRPGNG